MEESDDLSVMARATAEWYTYDEALRSSNRVVVADSEYFTALLDECLSTVVEWSEPREVFRARVMPPGKEGAPFAMKEMGAPPGRSASGGRLNPPGITYLYVALDSETAIAEVRPWNGAKVTVCKFETLGRLRLVDLSDVGTHFRTLPRATFAAHVMQTPAHRDDAFSYVATQYLSEHLKSRDADGVIYGSSLKIGGTNVALFRPELARPVATQFWMLGQIAYTSYPLTDLTPDHPYVYE